MSCLNNSITCKRFLPSGFVLNLSHLSCTKTTLSNEDTWCQSDFAHDGKWHYTYFPMNDELPTHAICILEVGITKGSKTSGAVLLSPFKCRILYKDGAFIAYIFDSPWPKHNRGSQIWEIILVVRKKAEKWLADAWILFSHRQDDMKRNHHSRPHFPLRSFISF